MGKSLKILRKHTFFFKSKFHENVNFFVNISLKNSAKIALFSAKKHFLEFHKNNTFFLKKFLQNSAKWEFFLPRPKPKKMFQKVVPLFGIFFSVWGGISLLPFPKRGECCVISIYCPQKVTKSLEFFLRTSCLSEKKKNGIWSDIT